MDGNGDRGSRRWRRPPKGISPIIGIILLVAITVVLAAVLYVMVSGLSDHGTAAKPLGTALALGPASEVTGSKTTNSYCKTGYPCYSVSIASVSSSLTLGDLELVLLTSSGTAHIVQTSSGQISVVNGGTTPIAYTSVTKGNPLESTAWAKFQKGVSEGTTLSDTMTIWVQFGSKTLNPVGQGYRLEAIGTGSFSGTIDYLLP
jgi:archaeal type IV pilus assembly protein PilA